MTVYYPTLFFHPSQVTIDRGTAIFSPETRKRAIRLTYVAVARLLLHCSLQSQFWHWCSRVTPLYDRVRERGRERERRENASFKYERSGAQKSRKRWKKLELSFSKTFTIRRGDAPVGRAARERTLCRNR